MQRRHRSAHSQTPFLPIERLRLAFLTGVVLTLCACGGGGVGNEPIAGTLTVPADPQASAEVRTLTPASIQANFNDPLELTGRGFVAPARVLLRDDQGTLLGSAMEAEVLDGGRRLRTSSPMLPEIAGRRACLVEVRNGDGAVLELDQDVFLECLLAETRTMDGTANNTLDPGIGAAGTALRRDVTQAYADGVSAPSGVGRPSAREVSNLLCAQEGLLPAASGASDMFWLWGQFIDHDIDLTGASDPAESFAIQIPEGDPYFDPFATGLENIPFTRSTWLPETGTDPGNPRRQPNEVTAWIDASNVYGSDRERANALRTLDGSGRMRTSSGDLLPFNTAGFPNAPTAAAPNYFLAGDVRANEQVGLTALHTLFVREHNRLADEYRAANPHLTGDEIYQAARRWVGAELQVITRREFLPLLLGNNALPPYAGYDESVDGSIGVLFSSAAYRFGHSMVSGTVLRLDASGETIAEGSLSLRDAFFNPRLLPDEGGIEPVLRGFTAQVAQALDPLIVDDLRNFLFGPPGAGGMDLAALNMQRGRDHGLPSYNACRIAFGLPVNAAMEEISSDTQTRANLAEAYGDTADIDVWVGALCEEQLPGAMVGELLHRCFSDQFRRLRDGDRFWYQTVYAGEALNRLEGTRLADVIRRNSTIGGEISDLVMVVRDGGSGGVDRPPPRPRDGNARLQALAISALSR